MIMVIGVGAMFLLSIIGLNEMDEMSKEGGKNKTEEITAAKPEDIYKKSCIGCHGDQYQGAAGPSLLGVGDRYSHEEIKEIITKGKNGRMPAGLVPEEKADEMADWLTSLKK